MRFGLLLVTTALLAGCGCTTKARPPKAPKPKHEAPSPPKKDLAQSYVTEHRNGIRYTEPATCFGARACLERVCEDYADMLGTKLHETPDHEDGGIMCVLEWSSACVFYPEVSSVKPLCTVRVY